MEITMWVLSIDFCSVLSLTQFDPIDIMPRADLHRTSNAEQLPAIKPHTLGSHLDVWTYSLWS